jgi:nitroreductase
MTIEIKRKTQPLCATDQDQSISLAGSGQAAAGLQEFWSMLQLETSDQKSENPVCLEDAKLTVEKCFNVSCGVISKFGAEDVEGRASPSAGALYPTIIFFFELKEDRERFALYRFTAATCDIEQMSVSIPREILLDQLGLDPSVRTVFLFAADLERSMGKYGRRGILYASLDTAHGFCNLYLLLHAETQSSWVLEGVSSAKMKALVPSIPASYLPVIGLATSKKFDWRRPPERVSDLFKPVRTVTVPTEFGSPDWVLRNIYSRSDIVTYPTSQLPLDLRRIFERSSAELFSEFLIEHTQIQSLVRDLVTLNGFEGFAIKIALWRDGQHADLFDVKLPGGSLSKVPGAGTWDIVKTCMGQKFLGNASAALAIYIPEKSGDFFESAPEFRRAIVNAGFVAQQAYLKAAEEQIGICAVGGYTEEGVREMMGLTADEPVLYLAALGVKSTQVSKTDRGKIAFSHGKSSGSSKELK